MKKMIEAEVNVIDRMIDTLGEESVGRLVREDVTFARYIDQLYDNLHHKSRQLTAARDVA